MSCIPCAPHIRHVPCFLEGQHEEKLIFVVLWMHSLIFSSLAISFLLEVAMIAAAGDYSLWADLQISICEIEKGRPEVPHRQQNSLKKRLVWLVERPDQKNRQILPSVECKVISH